MKTFYEMYRILENKRVFREQDAGGMPMPGMMQNPNPMGGGNAGAPPAGGQPDFSAQAQIPQDQMNTFQNIKRVNFYFILK